MNNFEKACEMSLNDWLATIPDIVPEAEYTKNHEKWKKKLFNKMRDNRYHTFTTKTVKVLLVAAVLSALLLTAFLIPSSREYIIDNFEIFSRYKITENNKNSVNGEITVGYIPEGFELVNKQVIYKGVVFDYASSNGLEFTIKKHSSSMEIDFNTEDSIIEEKIVDDTKYTFCEGNFGINNIIWTKNDYVYLIDGPFANDEMIKIAKTVK